MSSNGTPGTEVALTEPHAMPAASGPGMGFNDANAFALLQRVATMFANCDLVPEVYRGKNKVANCAIVADMAQRVGCAPLMAFQNLNIINGRPGWNSQFLIASVNASGRFEPLEFEFFGEDGKDSRGCRAYTKRKGRENVLYGPKVTIAMAKAEGWYGRKGSKWPTMTELMLTYRAAAFWVRIFAPEMASGLLTAEEQHDIVPVRQLETVASQVQSEPTPVAAPASPSLAEQQEAVDCLSTDEAVCDADAEFAETASPTPSSADSPPSPAEEGTPSSDDTQAADDAAVQAAYDAGRDAVDLGAKRVVPKDYRYKAHQNAWLEGYDYQLAQNAENGI